jgi:hypothetical protein
MAVLPAGPEFARFIAQYLRPVKVRPPVYLQHLDARYLSVSTINEVLADLGAVANTRTKVENAQIEATIAALQDLIAERERSRTAWQFVDN